MVNLVTYVLNMMNSFELYRDSMSRDMTHKDYHKLCLDSKYLLGVVGETNVRNYELSFNSEELKRGIHALQTIASQVDEDIIDKDLVDSSYRIFKENSPIFMKNLFEIFIMNQEVEREDKFQ